MFNIINIIINKFEKKNYYCLTIDLISMVKLKIIIIISSSIIIITRPTTLALDMVARPKVAWIWHGVHKSNFHLPLS